MRIDVDRHPFLKKLLFALLYAAEGAPIGFIWWALPAEMRFEKLSIEQITELAAVLVIPWTFKFLWAPMIDWLQSKMGGYKTWIFLAQILMGLTLIPTANLNLKDHYDLIFMFLIIHSFAAATQDVAIDGWAINISSHAERGRLVGWMQLGNFSGRWLFGAGLLFVSQYIPRPLVVYSLVAWIWVIAIILPLVKAKHIHEDNVTESEPGEEVSILRQLKNAIQDKRTWLGLWVALIAGACYKGVDAVISPLLVDLGFDKGEIALFLTLIVPAMVMGSLGGGWLADKFGHRKIFIQSMIALFILSVLLSLGLWKFDSPIFAYVVLIIMHFGMGSFLASSYALYMDITNPKIASTQFSAFMGMTNGCESWTAIAAGRLTAAFSYPFAIVVMSAGSLIAIPSILLLTKKKA